MDVFRHCHTFLWDLGHLKHGLYAIGLKYLIAPTLSLLEMRRLRNHLAFAITALASFAGIVYLWMNVTDSDPQNLRGLTQRIFALIDFLWLATIAFLHLWPTETTTYLV